MELFFIIIIGAVIGSFLGMLSYRLPNNLSLLTPARSFCPKCDTQLKWFQNIPLFSFLVFKGKCKFCNNKISWDYFFIELISVTITVSLYMKFGLNIEFLLYSLLFYILILLSFIDLSHKAVPDYLLLILVLSALSFQEFSIANFLLFVGGAFILEFVVTFYIQNIKAKLTKNDDLKNQRAMGEGDIPIFGVIGGLIGVELGLIAVFLAAVLALIPSLFSMILKKEIETPFIPYLSMGLFFVIIFENLFIGVLNKV